VLKIVRRRNQDLTVESLASAVVSLFGKTKALVAGTDINKLDETPTDTRT
jgi:hypothetical protein